MRSESPARFLGTGRGRIVGLLREAPRTAGELARALNITENGARSHLNTLERDGLVHQAGTRAGTRKPFHSYELTPAGEALFPRAYGSLLAELLQVLSMKLTEAEFVAACRETGRRLANKLAPGRDRIAFEQRVALALEVLTSIGAIADVTEATETVMVVGRGCPIAQAVSVEPHACGVTQGLIEEITGAEVRECCSKGENPRCKFEIQRPTS